MVEGVPLLQPREERQQRVSDVARDNVPERLPRGVDELRQLERCRFLRGTAVLEAGQDGGQGGERVVHLRAAL